MVKPKSSQYRGGASLKSMVEPYSDQLRERLRQYYPAKNAFEEDSRDEEEKEKDEFRRASAWGDPADDFVNKLLAASNWAASMIHHMQEDINNETLKAEYADLLKTLEDAEKKLRTISPALDRLISAAAEPENLADQIQEMIGYIVPVKPRVDNMPRAMRPEQKKIPFAKEMVVLVFEVLDEYGIKPIASEGADGDNNMANAIKILAAIGREIGLSYDPQTWRRHIEEAILHK